MRVVEGGSARDRIDLEKRGGFARMVGGPERLTLFMPEAFAANPERVRGPANGRIRTVEVDVPGAGLP